MDRGEQEGTEQERGDCKKEEGRRRQEESRKGEERGEGRGSRMREQERRAE